MSSAFDSLDTADPLHHKSACVHRNVDEWVDFCTFVLERGTERTQHEINCIPDLLVSQCGNRKSVHRQHGIRWRFSVVVAFIVRSNCSGAQVELLSFHSSGALIWFRFIHCQCQLRTHKVLTQLHSSRNCVPTADGKVESFAEDSFVAALLEWKFLHSETITNKF